MDSGPNQDGSFFEPVKFETLAELEDAIFDSPYATRLNPQKISPKNPHRVLGTFTYLELENRDADAGDITIQLDGKWLEWFDEEVTVYSIDLGKNFTPQGWENTRFMIIRNVDGEMLATKQISLVNQSDEEVFSFRNLVRRALEGDEESLAELYEVALKNREEVVEQARALEMEHGLGLAQVSEQEIKELMNLIKTGWLPTS